MSAMMQNVVHLAEEIGSRPAGTEEERTAAEYIKERIEQSSGLPCKMEDFNAPISGSATKTICSIVGVVAGWVGMALPEIGILCLVLLLIATVLLVADYLEKPILDKVLPRGISQNVVAKYESGIMSSKKNRKIILVARYDSGKVRDELKGSLLKSYSILQKISFWALPAMFVFMFIRVVPLGADTGAAASFFKFLVILCTLACLVPIVFAILHKISKYNNSANANAAGTAVLMEVASRVGNGRMTEEQIQFLKQYEDQENQGDQDIPEFRDVQGVKGDQELDQSLIYGKAALDEEGVLPNDVPVYYEADVNAQLPHNELNMRGNSEKNPALYNEDAEDVLTFSTDEDNEQPFAEMQGGKQKDLQYLNSQPQQQFQANKVNNYTSAGADTSQQLQSKDAAGQNAASAALGAQATDNQASGQPSVPSWYKAAQSKAKKQPVDAAMSAQYRSKFASALDAVDKANEQAAAKREAEARASVGGLGRGLEALAQENSFTQEGENLEESLNSLSDRSVLDPQVQVSHEKQQKVLQEESDELKTNVACDIEQPEFIDSLSQEFETVEPHDGSHDGSHDGERVSVSMFTEEEKVRVVADAKSDSAKAAALEDENSEKEAEFTQNSKTESSERKKGASKVKQRKNTPRTLVDAEDTVFEGARNTVINNEDAKGNIGKTNQEASKKNKASMTGKKTDAQSESDTLEPASNFVGSVTAGVDKAAQSTDNPLSLSKKLPVINPSKTGGVSKLSSNETGAGKQRAPLADDTSAGTAKSLLSMLPSIGASDIEYEESLIEAASNNNQKVHSGLEKTASAENKKDRSTTNLEDDSKRDASANNTNSANSATKNTANKNVEADTETKKENTATSSPSLSGTIPSITSGGGAGATGVFAPVTDEMLQSATSEEDLFVDDADDSDFQENFTESGAYAGRDYVEMPKSRVRGFFDKVFHRSGDKEESSDIFDDAWDDSTSDAWENGSDSNSFESNGAEYYEEYGGEYSDSSEYDQDEEYSEYGDYEDAEDNNQDAQDTEYSGAPHDEYVGASGEKYNGGAFSALKEKASGLTQHIPASSRSQDDMQAQDGSLEDLEDGDLDDSLQIDGEEHQDRINSHARKSSSSGARRGAFSSLVEEQSHESIEDLQQRALLRQNAAEPNGNAHAQFVDPSMQTEENLDNPEFGIPEEGEEIEAFRNPMLDCDVWFVALGSELAGNAGMKNFMDTHKEELRGAIIIELDGLGAGNLSMVGTEGSMKQTKYSSRMKRFTRKATQVTGIKCATVNYSWCDSAAAFANKHGASALHLVGDDGGKPAFFAQANDIVDNINESTLDKNAEFVMEVLRAI